MRLSPGNLPTLPPPPASCASKRSTARQHPIRILLIAAWLALQGSHPAASLPANPGANRAEVGRPLTVVFRFDDYSAKSDTALERSILESFRRARVPLTVSVIPRMAAV